MPTPTVRRLQLGNELRRLRERAGLSHEDAGKVIERAQSSMSRLEHGETGIRPRDLRDLVTVYAKHITTGDPVDVEWYLELNKGAEQRGRWTGYRSVYAKWFRMVVDLEADASAISAYHAEGIHGLLQTEDYMLALFTAAKARRADQDTDAWIRARLARQAVLTKPDAPKVTFVLSESSIRRQVGPPKVMRGQHEHLLEVAELPNVHLHILPFRCDTAPDAMWPFTHFRVPAASDNAPPLEFLFVETYTDGTCLDSNEDLDQYAYLWSQLLGAALDPVRSRKLVAAAAKDFP